MRDDAYASLWRASTAARVLSFGLRHEADFRAEAAALRRRRSRLRDALPAAQPQRASVQVTPGAGRTSQRAQRAGRGGGGRQRRGRPGAGRGGPGAGARGARPAAAADARAHGAWLIDDSYNANPSSARAGLEVLARTAGTALAGAGRHGRARRIRRRTATARSASSRARWASNGCSPSARWRRWPPRRFGAGAERFRDAGGAGARARCRDSAPTCAC